MRNGTGKKLERGCLQFHEGLVNHLSDPGSLQCLLGCEIEGACLCTSLASVPERHCALAEGLTLPVVQKDLQALLCLCCRKTVADRVPLAVQMLLKQIIDYILR